MRVLNILIGLIGKNGSQHNKYLLKNVSSNNVFNYILFTSNNLENNTHPYLSKDNTKSFDGY